MTVSETTIYYDLIMRDYETFSGFMLERYFREILIGLWQNSHMTFIPKIEEKNAKNGVMQTF